MRKRFQKLLLEFDSVFDPEYKGYNGAAGQVVVNIGPAQPPQRKSRVPQYARGKLVELQESFDKLQALGVFKRSEDVGVA